MKANSLMKKSASLLMVLSILCSVFSVGMTASAKTPSKYVKSMTLAKSKLTLDAGKTAKVKVNFKVVKKASTKFTVKTSNKKVATVKVAGSYVQITAKSLTKKSKATITVKSKAKNKSGKYISKKIAVTVNAKKVVKKVNYTVSISPKTITVGGTAKIKVTAAKGSATIKKITYKSSNTAVAKVSSNGVVTGVSASDTPVVITVSASAATGKAVTKTVSITVKAAANAKISSVAKQYTLAIGETVTLNPVAENAKPEFNFSSSNTSVATVSKDGVVKAVSAGTADITITIPGTSAVAVCSITVSANDISVTGFSASHSNRLTVNLSTTVSKADQSKLVVELAKGSVSLTNTITVIWSDNGKSFDISTGSDFDPSSYTVTISSNDLPVKPNANTMTYTVAERVIKKIEIVNSHIAKFNGAKVYFNAVDQYGDAIHTVTGEEFSWNISTSESIDVNSISIDKTKAGYIVFKNLQNVANVEAGSTTFSITARSIKNPDEIYTTKKVEISSLIIKTIKLKENSNKIYQNTSDQIYTLNYEAKDQFGEDIDWSLYDTKNNAYNNSFTSSSSDPTIVEAPIVYEGKLVVKVKANKHGTSTISIDVGEQHESITFVVLEAAKPVKIQFPEYGQYSLIAGDNKAEKIPVTFIDQYGAVMPKGSVSKDMFTEVFGTPKSTVAEIITGYTVTSQGDYITLNAINVAEHGKVTLTYVAYDAEGKLVNYEYTIEITPKRKANSIKIVAPDPVPSKLVVGEKVEFKFQVLDNNGSVWTNDNIKVEMVSSNKHYIDIEDITLSKGEGTMTIKAINKSYDTQDNVYLTFNLYDKITNELIATTEGSTAYPVTVYDNVETFKVETEAADSVKSGQAVTLTITAYNNNAILTTYDKEFEQVQFKEYKSSTNTGKFQPVTVKFVNGIAKVTLRPVTVGKINFKATIPVLADKKLSVASAAINVVPGDASKYTIEITTTTLKITCYDSNNNVKTDYVPEEKTYITLVQENSTVTADQYISGVGTNGGETIISFEDGVATLKLKKDLTKLTGASLTITTGDITITKQL